MEEKYARGLEKGGLLEYEMVGEFLVDIRKEFGEETKNH